ncbi:polyphosphate kinase 2 family protein [Calidifontibacter indicus]|uniref:polyphosphate kinase 2 family protein n=1 Tax=Calidifontibacter indicus TaxID=419650 RepID=UPI003D72250D
MAKKKSKTSEKGAEKSVDLAAKITEKLRVTTGFELASLDASSTPGFKGDKAEAAEVLADTDAEIDDLQERLYANGKDGDGTSVLLVVQGMDTSGKGGIMRHVVGSVDPQGVSLTAFKSPTAEEKKHPFLWRIRKGLPEPGMIAVFDRSHYEDVLIVRVHNLVPASTWQRRYGQINTFEQSVTDSGTKIIKIMLHIDADEQKARLAERLDRPDKWWKFNPGDLDERAYWDHYQEAYQALLDKTSTDSAPWYVVPANRKWYARLAVQQILLHHLRGLDQPWPEAEFDVEEQKARLAEL